MQVELILRIVDNKSKKDVKPEDLLNMTREQFEENPCYFNIIISLNDPGSKTAFAIGKKFTFVTDSYSYVIKDKATACSISFHSIKENSEKVEEIKFQLLCLINANYQKLGTEFIPPTDESWFTLEKEYKKLPTPGVYYLGDEIIFDPLSIITPFDDCITQLNDNNEGTIETHFFKISKGHLILSSYSDISSSCVFLRDFETKENLLAFITLIKTRMDEMKPDIMRITDFFSRIYNIN